MAYNNKKAGYNNFDLNNYETVKSRKVRLRNDFPNSVIMPVALSDLNYAGNYVLIGALIWKDKKDIIKEEMKNITEMVSKVTPQNAGVVMSTIGILTGADGVGYSLSIAGGKGADKTAWVENAEESAVGRALDNMGYHSGSASQEEMKKVQHIQEAQQTRVQLENQINALYGQLFAQGQNPQYLSQVISQTVRQFNHLSELSPDELEKLLNALQSINGQNQQMQQPPQQNNVMPLGAPAPR